MLAKARGKAWDLVVFDLDDVAAAGVSGLSGILKEYMVSLGDPVSFVVKDKAGRLSSVKGVERRANVVRDLSEAKGTVLEITASEDEDDLFLDFDDDGMRAAMGGDTAPEPDGFEGLDAIFGSTRPDPATEPPAAAATPTPPAISTDDLESVFASLGVPEPGDRAGMPAQVPAAGDDFDDFLSSLSSAPDTATTVPAPAAMAPPVPASADPLAAILAQAPTETSPAEPNIEAILASPTDPLAAILGGTLPPIAPAAPSPLLDPAADDGMAALLGIGGTSEPSDMSELASLLGGSHGGTAAGPEIVTAGSEDGAGRKKGGIGAALRTLMGGEAVPKGVLYPLDRGVVPPQLDKTYFITCWAPKGGTGKTTSAVALGHYLAWGLGEEYRATQNEAKRPRVLLVDLDEFADAYMQSVALREKYSIKAEEAAGLKTAKDLYNNLASVNDWETLSGYLAVEPMSGLYMLLPQQNDVDYDAGLNDVAYGKMMDKISRHFDFVIFDCGPVFLSSPNGLTPFAIGRSNVIVLVGDQTFQTIIHTVKYFSKIVKKSPLLCSVKDHYIYVVNKYNPKAPSPLSEIKLVMEKFVSEVIEIPDDPESGLQTAYDGVNILFSGNANIKMAYKRLTESVLSRVKGQVTGFVAK